jgi:hypothetical protein
MLANNALGLGWFESSELEGVDSDPGGGRRCLEVPPTGYTATANSNLYPGPHGPEP